MLLAVCVCCGRDERGVCVCVGVVCMGCGCASACECECACAGDVCVGAVCVCAVPEKRNLSNKFRTTAQHKHEQTCVRGMERHRNEARAHNENLT